MRLQQLYEGLSDWQGSWVHYSNVPQLTIRNKPLHQDPSGLYLFPERFKPVSFWQGMKYKITVDLKSNINILDMEKVTPELIKQMLEPVAEQNEWLASDLDGFSKDTDSFWSALRQHFLGRPATFNKYLRSFGYDAVFDDTGSIHTSEVQLLVLNPRMIVVRSIDKPKNNSYTGVLKVMNDLEGLAKEINQPFQITPPKRKKDYNEDVILSKMTIGTDDNYAYISVRCKIDSHKVDIHLSYSKPQLNYGVGAEYNARTEHYERDQFDRFKTTIAKLFQ